MSSKSAIEEVLLTITIDTECDHDPQWRRSDPLAFESILEGLPNRLQPVYTDVGAIPTYLLTVEVLEDEECVRTLKSLDCGMELGTHLHAAFIEPDKKFFDYAGVDSPDFQCNYPAEIEYQKLANLTQLFHSKLGYAPRSFRAGRFGAGANTVNALEKLGYKVDTSVTPLLQWHEPNGSVDFRRAPLQPYFPSADSLTSAVDSSRQLLEVPITVKSRQLRRNPAWFRPWFSSVDNMKAIFKHHVTAFADQPVVTVNMMFHSMEVIAKASPYPQNDMDVGAFLDDMHKILLWCKQEGVTFCGVSDCYEKYLSVVN